MMKLNTHRPVQKEKSVTLRRTDAERALLEKAQQYLPGGTLGNLRPPDEVAFVVKEGRGSRLYDVSGNQYIDYMLGSGPMFLGHAHPAVVEAVGSYLGRGTTYFTQNEPAILLAEKIVQAVPCADKVRFTTSGTDAVFQCLRLARAYRKRDKVLKFEGGYHGSSDYGLMSVAPREPQDFPVATPGGAGIPKAIEELMLVAPFNDIDTTVAIIEKHHDELAGVVLEPFQRLLPPKPGFLQGLRDVTSRHEIPLIFDEVVTGFRFAYGGAQEYYGVTPDLAAYGKIVGGGFPLAVVAGREELMQLYDPAMEGVGTFVPQVGTLNGNPIAATAGLATLRVLQSDTGVYQRVFGRGHQLRQALQELLDQAEIPAKVVGEDVVFDVYFTDQEISDYRSTMSANEGMLKRFNRLLLENGVLKGGSKFYVGMCHTPQDVEETVAAFKKVVNTLRE